MDPTAARRTMRRQDWGTGMIAYFMQFQIVGEVADMLLMDGADRRLLVDFSALPAVDAEHRQRRYPTRATFTIRDEATIERFLTEMSVGDVAEATGSFEQGNYVPYRTTCIDTTFLLEDFRKIQKPARRKSYRVPAPAADQDTPLLH
jgi:hypothetical protein